MIHHIHAANQHLYTAQLWEMHRARRAQFIEHSGWTDLFVINGGEFDDYDDELAHYLLDLGPEGEVRAGVRVRQTIDRCMLVDKFPSLIAPEWPAAKGIDVWEITRLFTTTAYRRNSPRHGEAVHRVVLAAQQVAFAQGVTRFVGILDMHTFPLVSNGPQRVKLMGLPQAYEHGIIVGAEGEVSEDSMLRLREALALDPYRPIDIEHEGADGVQAPDRIRAVSLTRLKSARSEARRSWDQRAPETQVHVS